MTEFETQCLRCSRLALCIGYPGAIELQPFSDRVDVEALFNDGSEFYWTATLAECRGTGGSPSEAVSNLEHALRNVVLASKLEMETNLARLAVLLP